MPSGTSNSVTVRAACCTGSHVVCARAVVHTVDLLAETNEGKFWAIQCKFRSDSKKPLTYRELSTFTSLALVSCPEISLQSTRSAVANQVRKHKYDGNATERAGSMAGPDRRGLAGHSGPDKRRPVPLTHRLPRPHQQKAMRRRNSTSRPKIAVGWSCPAAQARALQPSVLPAPLTQFPLSSLFLALL